MDTVARLTSGFLVGSRAISKAQTPERHIGLMRGWQGPWFETWSVCVPVELSSAEVEYVSAYVGLVLRTGVWLDGGVGVLGLKMCSLNVCVLEIQFPNPYVNGIWRWGLWDGLKLDGIMMVALYDGTGGFRRRQKETRACVLPLCGDT